jgi:hypothetical protein
MTARRVLSLLFLSSLAVGAVLACSGPDKGSIERKVSTRGSPGSFRGAGVSKVFEKRCGSLDCHGSLGRNMRIYSASGLRLPNDAGLKPGVGDTTIDETSANYLSIMSLEPELMNKVLDGQSDPGELLILRKPLEIEKHKGGPAIKKADVAEACITSWLKEDGVVLTDKASCAKGAIFPIE